MEAEPSPLELALRQREAGQIDDAIATLVSAASGALGDPELALTLAKMLAETDQLDRAEPWFKHALKLAPENLVVRMGYGTFLAQRGRHEEARAALSAVLDELADAIGGAEDGDPLDACAALEDLVAVTSMNLARSELECGHGDRAQTLVQPWLAHERHWPFAHNVLADLIEQDHLDPLAIAREGLESGAISPYMVCYLIERALDDEPLDFAELDRIIGRAEEALHFPWRRAAPELVTALSTVRQRFGHAVMRGLASPGALPHLEAACANDSDLQAD